MHGLSTLRHLNETEVVKAKEKKAADKEALNEIARRHRQSKPRRKMLGALGATIE